MAREKKNTKKDDTQKEPQTIELEQMNVFLLIPKEAVSLEVIAQVIDEKGKLMKVKRKQMY